MGEHTAAPMQPGLYNMDCMEALKQFPDGFFDLAVVDPPYGDAGLAENSIGGGGALAKGSTGISMLHPSAGGVQMYTFNEKTSENRTAHGVTRTGGTWATKYAKKLLRGTLPRGRSILTSCSASHETRSSGGATISTCRRAGVF